MDNAQQADGLANGAAASEIAALLSTQRDLYLQLSQLTEQQRGLITGDEPEQLLTLLAQRQQIIDQLQAVSARLRPYQANWRQVRGRLGEDESRQIDGLVGEINALLADIMKQDETDTALLSARKGETHRAIGTLQTGRQASRAYAVTYGGQSQGIDWTQA